jgi:hypothetical protein
VDTLHRTLSIAPDKEAKLAAFLEDFFYRDYDRTVSFPPLFVRQRSQSGGAGRVRHSCPAPLAHGPSTLYAAFLAGETSPACIAITCDASLHGWGMVLRWWPKLAPKGTARSSSGPSSTTKTCATRSGERPSLVPPPWRQRPLRRGGRDPQRRSQRPHGPSDGQFRAYLPATVTVRHARLLPPAQHRVQRPVPARPRPHPGGPGCR